MKYGITGATGSFGTRAIETLAGLVEKKDIIALARTPENALLSKELGLEIRESDFDNRKLLDNAFKGIDKLLLVSTNEPIAEKRIQQHKNAIESAKLNGIKLIVYTSGVQPEASPLGVAHVETEKLLKESGVPFIILRNNLYLETKNNDIKLAMEQKPIVSSTGTGRMGLALRNDYADSAVNALLKGEINRTYNLSSNLVNYEEFTKALEKVIGKSVVLSLVDDAQYQTILENIKFPAPMIPMMVANGKSIRNGALDLESNDFEELLGRKVTPLETCLEIIIKKISD